MVERIRLLLAARQLTPTQFADAIGIARPIVSHILSGRNKPSLEVVQRILAAMPDLSMPWLLNGTGSMLAIGADLLPSASSRAVVTAQESAIASSVESAGVTPSGGGKQQVVPAAGAALASPGATQVLVKKTLIEDVVNIPVASHPVGSPNTASNTASTPNRQNSAPEPPVARVRVPPIAHSRPQRFTPSGPALPISTSGPAAKEPVAPPIAATTVPGSTEIIASPQPLVAGPSAASSAAPDASFAASALFAGTEKPIRRIVIFYRDGSFGDYQPE